MEEGLVMKPYYEEDGITIYHGDCRDVVPNLGLFDLLLTDPPMESVRIPTAQHPALSHSVAPGLRN